MCAHWHLWRRVASCGVVRRRVVCTHGVSDISFACDVRVAEDGRVRVRVGFGVLVCASVRVSVVAQTGVVAGALARVRG